MTPEEFRRAGHALIDWIADYRAGLAELPVMAPTEPGSIRSALPAAPPDAPEPIDAILEDLGRVVLPGLTHWQSPRFFGFFPSNGELASVLGDLASTGLGVLGLSWQASPALTEVEELVCDWVRQMVGLGSGWRGVIQDTASTGALVALIEARERTTAYGLAGAGLQSGEPPLVVYVSAHAHSSVEKAALLAGFGKDFVRKIAVDDRYAMRADALEAAMLADKERGLRPCAVVATTGTTTTTAFDPIAKLAIAAKAHGAWLHVDAAMAGSGMILPELRRLWEGVEEADSLVINAHKWLGAAFDCSLYYVRDPEHLVRVMSTNPSYLQSSADGRVQNLRDWGIPLGRRFRALKLWFLLRERGVSALQERLRRDLANAAWLRDAVSAQPGWRVLAPVELQTVCVRNEPNDPALDDAALDKHTLAWAERINRSGKAYVTPAILDGRWMVRVSIGSLSTTRADVEELWETLKAAVSATRAPSGAQRDRAPSPA